MCDKSGFLIERKVPVEKHEESLLQRLNKLRQENPKDAFCDVSFNINGKQVHAHKFVLVAASTSDYFQTTLEWHFIKYRNYDNVLVKDVEPEAFDEILRAIYTSELHVSRRNAYFILRASHMLMLKDIFKSIALYILTTKVKGIAAPDHLIEICLFVKQIEDENPYRECIAAIASDLNEKNLENVDVYRKCITHIASDLNNLSRTEAFAEKLTLEIFEDILVASRKNNLFNDDKALFRIIQKWCCYNKADEDAVLRLLNAADMKTGCFDNPTIVEHITDRYPRFDRETEQNTVTESSLIEQNSTANVGYNIYLNTVNIETGATGWGIWQSKKGFEFDDDFEVIYYVDSNKGYRKVKQIGNLFYCFEYDSSLNCNFFYYIENHKKTFLKVPFQNPRLYFDMEVLGNFVYLIFEDELLVKYNCETSEWKKVPIQITPNAPNGQSQSSSSPVSSITSRNHFVPKLASNNIDTLYVVGLKEWDVLRVFPDNPTVFGTNIRIGHKYKTANPAVCCWQDKGLLVVSGSNLNGKLNNEVSAYDMVAGKWKKMPNMKFGRANHSLTHDGENLYAIENIPWVGITNEKYNISENRWTKIPSLPERFNIIQNGKVIKLATGHLFNCSIQLTP